MTTTFLTKRTQCFYSLEIRNKKFKLVGFFLLTTKKATEGELREMVSCPHCAKRPVEYPNGYVYWRLDSCFTHSGKKIRIWEPVSIRGTWSQEYKKPRVWMKSPRRVYMVKRCSRTEHQQLMGMLKVRNWRARKIKRKLSQKSNNKCFKGGKKSTSYWLNTHYHVYPTLKTLKFLKWC